MSIEIIIPDIGEGKFPIIEVLVAVGDSVAAEDGIFVMESDKATMEVPAPADGIIASLTVGVGDEVGTGDVIGTMTVEEGKAPAQETAAIPTTENVADKPAEGSTEAPEPAVQEKTVAPAAAPTAATPTARTVIDEKAFRQAHASPSIRKLARELGVDLGKVTGTGRKARITEADVKQFIKSVLSGQTAVAGAVGASGIPPVPAQDFTKFGTVEEHKLSKINVLTGEHMTRCWLNIPHVTQYDEADITDLELFRQSLKAEAEKRGVRVTMLSFLMKALVSAMQALPKFNASLSADGQSLMMKNYYNIGIAVDTPNGLVVPVIKAVDQKSIYQLSEDLMTMSKKARDGKLTPADMSGGSMTISSLGGIGGTAFTPIVNAPEVAILGVSRSKMTPVWNGQEFEPRNMLPLSLSYDHRVIDGADGARFTRHLATLLGDARRMLL
ncbi:MAG: dihydrolipoyllysine-residue acetyltransferase [Gammaproteobacteria bacterium]|nr:MAG: dihydrolipoyllysine-residue acetyltransferase [Gammaproteobacteria bacterium]